MTVDVSPMARSSSICWATYVIPAEGGEAKSLTHGLAWTSSRAGPPTEAHRLHGDRAGGDNLWTAWPHAHAVSQETFASEQSAWTPDGECLAGRKAHFTSTRSAGARSGCTMSIKVATASR
jgi:hypothetical protein